MSDATGESDEVADLVAGAADDFRDRVARGENPDPEEYAARHPRVADILRGILGRLRRRPADAGGNDEPTPGGGRLGDYRILREVGRGGMGVVYEAEQISLRRRVALKVLPFAAVMDPRQLQRFHNEALAAAGLDHPHVVKVYGVGQDRGVHFIAMQYIDGQSLADLIRERRGPAPLVGDQNTTRAQNGTNATTKAPHADAARTSGDAAYFRKVAEWGASAADALEHAHEVGVVHRDIKPANLLVDGTGKLFVADFGLAKVTSDPGVTGTGDVLGTLRYMSPEQAQARHDLVDHRSDVYSLGVTLYELLTLIPAFDGTDRQAVLTKLLTSDPVAPRKVDRAVSRDLETVVLKALDKEPARRYPSAKELADDLRRVLYAEPVRARRDGRLNKFRLWCRRNPAPAVLSAVILFATAALSVTTVLFWTQKQRAEDQTRRAENAYLEEVRHRKRARQAVDTMYTDVAEKMLPQRPGTGGVRREFLLKALAFYEEEAAEQPGDVEALLQTAWASKRAGRIYWTTGDNDRAIKAYDRAVALVGDLVSHNPSGADHRALQAIVYFERSWVLHSLDRLPEAKTDRGHALELFERLAVDYPGVAEYRRQEAHICTRLGLFTTDDAESQKLFRRGLALAERLVNDFGPEGENQVQVAFACFDLGRLLARQPAESARAEAEQLLSRALPIWRGLTEGASFHPEYLYHLGSTLAQLGAIRGGRSESDQLATAFFNEAKAIYLRLDRDYAGHTPDGYRELFYGLRMSGRLDELFEFVQEAVRTRKGDAWLHWTLGRILRLNGKSMEAVVSFREAVRINPEYAEAHVDLGCDLRELGQFDESLSAYRRGHELGSRRKGWPYPSAEWVREAEQFVALEKKLPKVVTDEERPADVRELFALAETARYLRWYAASAKLYADVVQADQKYAANVKGLRYTAAGVAIMAGSGHGNDAGTTGADERSSLRRRALSSLRAQLAMMVRAAANPNNMRVVRSDLRDWDYNPYLAPVRDEAARMTLPDAEREDWRKLWADVAELKVRLGPGLPPPPPKPTR